MTPERRAKTAAKHLLAGDAATLGIGARIDAVGPDTATVSMTVRPDMLNGHGICHGGYIFMLADSAFAFACNAGNHSTVAQSNQITFLSPGRAGERLQACANAVAEAGRSGVYDVTVTGEDGRSVAVFRGLARRIKGQVFDEKGGENEGSDTSARDA